MEIFKLLPWQRGMRATYGVGFGEGSKSWSLSCRESMGEFVSDVIRKRKLFVSPKPQSTKLTISPYQKQMKISTNKTFHFTRN